MAITSIGYDGTVDEVQWTKLMARAAGSDYGVFGINDWKVTAHASLDRGVSIAAGSGWGHGVHDTSDTTVSLQGGTISSGVRWDMVVARRSWSGAGGTTTFAVVTGTTVKDLPVRQNTPGVLDEQPIALVQFTAGQTAATSIVDLRVWPGSGGMVAWDLLARNYHTRIGSNISIQGENWVSNVALNGSQQWVRQSALNAVQLFGAGVALTGTPPNVTAGHFMIQAGTTVNYFDQSGYARITWPTPFPNGLLTVIGMDGDDWSTGGSMTYASAGSAAWGSEGGGNRFSWVYAGRAQAASPNGYNGDPNNLIVNRRWPAGRIHRINWIAIGF